MTWDEVTNYAEEIRAAAKRELLRASYSGSPRYRITETPDGLKFAEEYNPAIGLMQHISPSWVQNTTPYDPTVKGTTMPDLTYDEVVQREAEARAKVAKHERMLAKSRADLARAQIQKAELEFPAEPQPDPWGTSLNRTLTIVSFTKRFNQPNSVGYSYTAQRDPRGSWWVTGRPGNAGHPAGDKFYAIHGATWRQLCEFIVKDEADRAAALKSLVRWNDPRPLR